MHSKGWDSASRAQGTSRPAESGQSRRILRHPVQTRFVRNMRKRTENPGEEKDDIVDNLQRTVETLFEKTATWVVVSAQP